MDANAVACEMLGYSTNELLGKHVWDLTTEENRIPLREGYQKFLRDREQRGEHTFIRKDGSIIEVEYYGIADLVPGYHLALLFDITERKAAEAVLRLSEEKFSKAFFSNPDLITISDVESGKYMEVNDAFLRAIGSTREQVIGKTDEQLAIWLDPEEAARVRQRLKTDGCVHNSESRLRAKGAARTVLRSCEVSEINGKRCVVSVTKDMTDYKRLEREFLEINDRERRRIGQDLHDNVGQHVTGICFIAKTLQQSLEEDGRLSEAGLVSKLLSYAREAQEKIRSLAKFIHPMDLSRDSLLTALQDLAHNVETLFGVHCTVETDARPHRFDENLTTNLYCIVQEAITNAVKHGRANTILVSLLTTRGSLRLTIQDNGVGLTPGYRKTKGLGLLTMQYRARVMGASLDIHSTKGKGTRVSCYFTKHQ